MNKYFIPAAIIIAGALIGGAFLYNNYSSRKVNTLEEENISIEQAGEKLVSFVNNNILRGQGVASIIDTSEENGIYIIKFDVSGQEVEWAMTKNGNFIFPQTIDLNQVEEPAEEVGATIGNFTISSSDLCQEDGKPIVYFFGSESCPHCQWEHPIINEVMGKFEGLVSYHNNMDTEDDSEIFKKYSTGGIPALVFGCKYYRVGSGEQAGLEAETKNLTALTCKLTGSQPEEVCNEVSELVNQIQ